MPLGYLAAQTTTHWLPVPLRTRQDTKSTTIANNISSYWTKQSFAMFSFLHLVVKTETVKIIRICGALCDCCDKNTQETSTWSVSRNVGSITWHSGIYSTTAWEQPVCFSTQFWNLVCHRISTSWKQLADIWFVSSYVIRKLIRLCLQERISFVRLRCTTEWPWRVLLVTSTLTAYLTSMQP